MIPRRKLGRLQKTACKRIRRLSNIATDIPTFMSCHEKNVAVSFVVIESLNSWGNFLRSFYLSCRIGTCFRNGDPVTCANTFTDFNQAIGDAILLDHHNWQPHQNGIWHRRQEPSWHDPNLILRLAQQQGWSNLPDIQAALSTGTQALSDLPIFRNYFAHRNQGTAYAARSVASNYVISTSNSPVEILLTRPYQRPNPLIVEWLIDMENVIEFLCDPL